MLGLVVFWQLADLVTFSLMVMRNGLDAELNPIAHVVTAPGAVLIKIALVAFLIRIYPHLGRYQTAVALIAILAGMVGAISNARAF